MASSAPVRALPGSAAPNAPVPTEPSPTSPPPPLTWTTPPPWPTAGRSPPGSSKAQHDSSSRTGWTSPARGGPPLAPKPSCTCAPSSPTATSTRTGNGTNSKNSAATTSTTTNNSILQPDPQLTAEEPHPSAMAHPTSLREYKSITVATYAQPSHVFTYVISPHHFSLGRSAQKDRPIRSGAGTGLSPPMVVRFHAFGWRPRRPATFMRRQTRLRDSRC